MTPARRLLAGAAALYALGLLAWLLYPQPLPAWATVLGAGGGALAAVYAASDSRQAHSATLARRLLRAAGWGLAGGLLAPLLGAALMMLRTALYARPQFEQAALLGLLARAPVWAGAGALVGLGVVLLRAALERQAERQQP